MPAYAALLEVTYYAQNYASIIRQCLHFKQQLPYFTSHLAVQDLLGIDFRHYEQLLIVKVEMCDSTH